MIEITNRTRTKVDTALVRRLASVFMAKYRLSGKDLSIAFIGDKAMRRLNRQYRQKDKPTDILSFAGEGSHFGELVVDMAQIRRQAPLFSGTAKKELAFILVHGLYHLKGYEDETESGKRKMERLTADFLKEEM